MRAGTLLFCLLSLSSSGCGWVRTLPARLGLTNVDAGNDERRRKPERASPFPAYILEAFPDARTVRLDSASPRLSLAAETSLTGEDPHLRRGPPRFSPDGRLLAYEEADTADQVRRLVIRRLDGVEIIPFPARERASPSSRRKRSWGSSPPTGRRTP